VVALHGRADSRVHVVYTAAVQKRTTWITIINRHSPLTGCRPPASVTGKWQPLSGANRDQEPRAPAAGIRVPSVDRCERATLLALLHRVLRCWPPRFVRVP